MNYNDFKDTVLKQIAERYADCQVDIIPVVKNNDNILDGILIKSEDSNIAPNIYLNNFYKEYENGKSMSDIIKEITDIYTQRDIANHFDATKIIDWEQAQDYIICKLCSVAENEQYLKDMPFTPLEDLAVTYHIAISQQEQGMMSSPIHNGLMELYGVDVETLHKTALKNMDILMPANFRSMQSVMEEIMIPSLIEDYGLSEEEAKEILHEKTGEGNMEMYVLSNECRINGAACILNPKTQEMVAEQLGGDFYILPSSTHEVLIVPKTEKVNYKELENMVREVNVEAIEPEERLSNHVYEYDSQTHELIRSDTAQERKKQRENPEKKQDEKKSLKEKLEEKKLVAEAQKTKIPKTKNRQAEQSR